MNTCPVCTKPSESVLNRLVGKLSPFANITSCAPCYEVAGAERAQTLGDEQVVGSTTRRTRVLAALAG